MSTVLYADKLCLPKPSGPSKYSRRQRPAVVQLSEHFLRMLVGLGAYKDRRFYQAYASDWWQDHSHYNAIMLVRALLEVKALGREHIVGQDITLAAAFTSEPQPFFPPPPFQELAQVLGLKHGKSIPKSVPFSHRSKTWH